MIHPGRGKLKAELISIHFKAAYYDCFVENGQFSANWRKHQFAIKSWIVERAVAAA
jgi:hypothetical protein